MTRGDFRNKLARMLDVNTTSPKPWTTAELDQILLESHESFAEVVRPIERAVFLPLRAGQVWYRLSSFSSDIMLPLRVVDTVNERRLDAMTIAWLDEVKDQWETTTGQSRYWTTAGWDWIGIYPHSASDGGLLRIDYVAWPQAALDDSTALEIDDEDEDVVLELAFSDAQAYNWDEDKALNALDQFARKTRAPGYRAHSRLAFRNEADGSP